MVVLSALPLGRAALYYKASLDTMQVIEKGAVLQAPSSRLIGESGPGPDNREMVEMKVSACHFLDKCDRTRPSAAANDGVNLSTKDYHINYWID